MGIEIEQAFDTLDANDEIVNQEGIPAHVFSFPIQAVSGNPRLLLDEKLRR